MTMLDLSAAFDTVHHETLLTRLTNTFGITGDAHKWLESYLTGRRQFVTINGARSAEQVKSCDVPQGSILGPNLYEDYTSVPVGAIFRKHEISFHIYADDTQAYVEFTAGKDEIEKLNKLKSCLNDVRIWMANNWLKLNQEKTEFIVFGAPKNLDLVQTDCLTLGESSVTLAENVRNIGFIFDSALKLDKQVAQMCRIAWFHLHQISKIKLYLTEDQLKTVIHAYVISRLDQYNSLLLGLPKHLTNKLQLVQNAAARLILGGSRRDHVTPLLVKLHWLPVEKRILFKVLLLVFKCRLGKAPSYLQELLVPYKPPSKLRSANKELYALPKRHYSETMKKDFAYRAPQEWNQLPSNVKDCDTIDSFKRALKTHFFKLAYY